MKRKIAYTIIGIGVVALVSGARFYDKSLINGNGYLGDEVIFFRESVMPQAEASANVTIEPADSKEEKETEAPTTTPESDAVPTASPEASAQPSTTAETKKTYDKIINNGKLHIYNTGTALIGDSAFELYNYVNSAASRYTMAVNKLTKKLDSSIDVYDMVAPTSMGVTFPDNKKKKINSSDQKEALENIENKLSGRERFIDLYEVMMQHRKEYIYFRTDHHWTSLGAYYAYRAFCEEKGITPHELSEYKKKTVKGFLGSFYRDTNQNINLREDILEAYYPVSTLTMQYTTTAGSTISAPVIADASQYSTSLKYCAFIAGDNPYTVIRNKSIKDGSSCVVVKESFGNAFVPYLADHYQTVYVIDYRYWEGDLCDFIKKKKSREVILINNISMTRNLYLIGKLTQIIS